MGTETMSLEKSIKYYKENQKFLAEKHHGEFVVIKDKSICGFYADISLAFSEACKEMQPGTFLIRQCIGSEEEQPIFTFSRVA